MVHGTLGFCRWTDAWFMQTRGFPNQYTSYTFWGKANKISPIFELSSMFNTVLINYKYVALISRKYFLRQILRNLLMSRLKVGANLCQTKLWIVILFTAITPCFYAPRSKIGGHIVFVLCHSVILLFCPPLWNFKLAYNFWTVSSRIFHMYYYLW